MADPITAAFTAIGSAIASATAATAGALTAVGIGAGAASSIAGTIFSYNTLFSVAALAFSALAAPKVNVEGSPTEWRPDPYAGLPVVLGRAATAGSIIHMDEHGEDNRYLTIANLLSVGPIQAIESFQADRVTVSFSGTGATSPTEYADKMWLSTSTGASATAISIGTLPHGSPSLQGWDSNSTLPGLAHTLWTLYQDSKFKSYPQGAPTPLHIIRGVKLYDPRKDSTYPGGSGSHRLDDSSTWEYSTNPGLHAIAWALGHKVTDPNTGKVFTVGIGCTPSGIHWPAFIELANVCDANDWEVSAVPTSKDDKHQVLKAILQAGGARYASLAGKISCIARTPRSSVVTVSARDAAGPFQIDVNADRLTRRNTITPRCVQEDHDWQMTAQDAVSVEDYVTADGGEIAQSLDFPYVAVAPSSANEAQPRQLAAYAMLDSRESIVGTVPFLPHLMQLEPGDVFTVDDPAWLLEGVELLCLKRTINALENTVQIAFVSESEGKHDFALGRTNTPPSPPGLTAPDIRTVPAPEAGIFTATVGTGGQPAIVLTASNIDAVHSGYIVDFRTAIDPDTGEAWADGDAGWQVYGQYDISTENVVLTGLEPETAYQVAIRYVSEFGIIGTRRVLATVTTGGMVATGIGDFNRDRLSNLIDELMSSAKAQERATVESLIEEARQRQGVDRKAVNLFTQERDARISGDEAAQSTITTQISAVNDSIAGVQSNVTTVANGLSALASSTTTQFSAVGTSLASLTTQYDTLATAQSASASAITTLSAQVFEEDGETLRLATVTDVSAVSADVEVLLATRLITAQAGAAYAGVQFSALQTDDEEASEIRFAGQVLAYGATFENPRRFFDAENGVEYALDAGGTVRTFELNWSTGRGQFRDASGGLLFDTAAGGVQYAGLPAITGSQVFENAAEVDLPSAGTWTEVASLSATTVASSRVFVLFSVRCIGGDGPINGRLKRGSTVIFEGQLAELFGLRDYNVIEDGVTNFDNIVQVPGVQNIAVTLFDVDEPGAGSQTYTLEAQGFDADNKIKDRKMIALDLRA